MLFVVTLMKKDSKTDIVFILLCLLWFVEGLKPGWIIPGLSPIRPLPTAIQYLLLGAWIFSRRKNLDNIQTKLFIAFVILMFVSTLFARNAYYASEITIRFPLLLITYLATINFADNFVKIKRIILIFLFSSTVIAILGIRYGGGVPHSPSFADQNDYSLLLNVLAPIAFFLAMGSSSIITKLVYYALVGIFLTGVVVSNSRGGFVGLAAIFLYCCFKSPKKAYFFTICSLIIIGMIFFAPKSYWDEMSTISQGTEEATAASRMYYWKVAIREFKDHPIIGVGPNNFGIWFPDYVEDDDSYSRYANNPGASWGRVAHSIYFTVLAEFGAIGVLLFTWLLYSFEKECTKIKNLWKQKNSFTASTREIHQSYFLSLGINGALIGYLASGAFISVLYYNWLYFLLTFLVGLSNAIHKNVNIEAEHGSGSRGQGDIIKKCGIV